MKLLTLFTCLEILTTHYQTRADTRYNLVPDAWLSLVGHSCSFAIFNKITEAIVSAHITQIQLGLLSNNAFYTFNFLGDGVSRLPEPTGCSQVSSTRTFNVGANECITKVEFWRNSDNYMYKIRFTLNSGTLLEHDATPPSTTNTLYTLYVPSGSELIGFWLMGDSPSCKFCDIDGSLRAVVCQTSYDFSMIQGLNLEIFTGTTITKTFLTYPIGCGSSFEYQVYYYPSSTTPGLISLLSPTSRSIQFLQSTNIADAKTYTIYVYMRQVGDLAWLTPTGIATFTYVNPCQTNLLTQIALTTMTTSVLVQTTPGGSPYYVTQTAKADNSVGTSVGSNVCGIYQYQIASTKNAGEDNLTSLELTIDINTGIISLFTSNKNTVGTHTATVTVGLPSYPGVAPAITTFTVQILPCIVTSFVMASLSPQTYIIGDPALLWSIAGNSVTTQVPACGYTQTLTSSTAPSFITNVPGTSINFSATSRNALNDANFYVLTVTASLDNYYNPIPPGSSPSSCQQTFTVTAVNPCLTTLITGTSAIGNFQFVQFEGYNTTTTLSNQFSDTATTHSGGTPDLCGNKNVKYKIDSVSTLELEGANNEEIIFSPQTGRKAFGTYPAEQIVTMEDYPTIKISYPFSVTVLASVKPVIQDQFYEISSTSLEIPIDQFSVLPESYNGSGLVESKLSVFVLDGGCSIPAPFHVEHYCLIPVEKLSWISFSLKNSTLTVETSEKSLVGSYEVFVVQILRNFDNVFPLVKFNITLKPQAEKLPIAPYFSPQLADLIVPYCFGQDLWYFKLPDVKDDQNSTVDISAEFDNFRFAFDPEQNILNQTQALYFDQRFGFKFTLTDQLGYTKTYQMKVSFLCKKESTPPPPPNFAISKSQVQKQKQWPEAYIHHVEIDGLMHIRFPQKMKIPDHPEYIQNETVSINGTDFPILQINIVPGKYSNFKNLRFNWTFLSFTPTELSIQLDFENVHYVSMRSLDPDAIYLKVYGYEMFSNERGEFMLPEYQLKTKVLPQMDTKERIIKAKEAAQTFQTVLNVVLMSNFVISILIAGPLQTILDSVKSLQTIIHLMLVNLAYPATSTLFFGLLMQVLTFQFYDFTDFYSRIFKLDEEGQQAFTAQFATMGYGSFYLVLNFGTLCWLFFLTPLCWIVASILSLFNRDAFGWIGLIWNRKMFYNDWIGLFCDTYLFLGMCVALNFKYFYFDNFGNRVNSTLAILIATILIALPLFIVVFYRRFPQLNFKQVREFQSRYGKGIEGLNFKRRGKWVLLYQCASMIQKIVLIVTVVQGQDYPVFSIYLFIFNAQVMLVIAGYTEPFIGQSSNRLTLLNESFVLLVTYHFFALTDFMTDAQNRLLVGYSLVVVTCLNVLICLGLLTVQTLSLFSRKLKLKYMAYKYQKQKPRGVNKLNARDAAGNHQKSGKSRSNENKKVAVKTKAIKPKTRKTVHFQEPSSQIEQPPHVPKAENPQKLQKKRENMPTEHNIRQEQFQLETLSAGAKISKSVQQTQSFQIQYPDYFNSISTKQEVYDRYLEFLEPSATLFKNSTHSETVHDKDNSNDLIEQMKRHLSTSHLPVYVVPVNNMKFTTVSGQSTKSFICLTVNSLRGDVIQIQEWYNGGLQSINILIDGQRKHYFQLDPNTSTKDLNIYRQKAMEKVRLCQQHFSGELIEKVMSGDVGRVLYAYGLQQRIEKGTIKSLSELLGSTSSSIYSKMNFGNFNENMDLESKIELYQQICVELQNRSAFHQN